MRNKRRMDPRSSVERDPQKWRGRVMWRLYWNGEPIGASRSKRRLKIQERKNRKYRKKARILWEWYKRRHEKLDSCGVKPHTVRH